MRARNYSLCGTLHVDATILGALSANREVAANGLQGDPWGFPRSGLIVTKSWLITVMKLPSPRSSARLRLGRCAKELRLLRDCSTVGAWIGRTEIQAGFAVVKDCLAAPHQ